MNIIVTGATGFVGRHLVPVLIQQGHAILELTRDAAKSTKLYGKGTIQHVLTEEQPALETAVKEFKPDVVLHLASFLTSGDSYADMEKLIHSNLIYLCRILDALKSSPPKLFINTGTFAEYHKGDGVAEPAYLYAATKTASRSFIEYYSKAYRFNYTTVIPYTIYGGTDSQKKIIDYMYDSLNHTETLALSPGEQILDFIHIQDVVDFYVTLINQYERIDSRSTFYLGSGKGHSLKEVAALMESLENKKCNIQWGGKSYRPADVMYAVANTSAQYHLFKWRPKVSLEQGLQAYLKSKS